MVRSAASLALHKENSKRLADEIINLSQKAGGADLIGFFYGGMQVSKQFKNAISKKQVTIYRTRSEFCAVSKKNKYLVSITSFPRFGFGLVATPDAFRILLPALFSSIRPEESSAKNIMVRYSARAPAKFDLTAEALKNLVNVLEQLITPDWELLLCVNSEKNRFAEQKNKLDEFSFGKLHDFVNTNALTSLDADFSLEKLLKRDSQNDMFGFVSNLKPHFSFFFSGKKKAVICTPWHERKKR